MNFSGVHTALVTPFTAGGETLDEPSLRRLVDWQIDQGISGLVAVGTTGESPTLTTPEHLRVFELCVEQAAGRVPVIAGAGSNSTAEAIELSQAAARLGCDALLLVSPYYNRPSQRGLVAHFQAVAAATGLPVMLYDIPGRTGVKLAPDTILEIARTCPTVRANKVATGDIADVRLLAEARSHGDLPPDFQLLSGDDALTLPFLRAGACGVVSVASNAFPTEVSALVAAEARGHSAHADELQQQLLPLFQGLLALDSNPVPIKAALERLGRCRAEVRLPLVSLTVDAAAELDRVLAQAASIAVA